MESFRNFFDSALLETIGNVWASEPALALNKISGSLPIKNQITLDFVSESVEVKNNPGQDIQFVIKPAKSFSFSVVIPTYNPSGTELDECLNSIYLAANNISSGGFEILIIDDCSSNSDVIHATVDKIKTKYNLSESKLRIIKSPTNGGPSSSRNLGFANTQYNFVFFVDSDDLIHPWYFSLLGTELLSGADMASTGMFLSTGDIFYSSNKSLSEIVSKNGNGSGIGLNKSGRIQELLKYRTLYNDKNHFHYEDWELNIALHLFGCKIKIIPIPLYFYRVKNSGRNLINDYLHLYSHLKAPLNAILSTKHAAIDYSGKSLLPFIEHIGNVCMSAIYPEKPGSFKHKIKLIRQILLDLDSLICSKRYLFQLAKKIQKIFQTT